MPSIPNSELETELKDAGMKLLVLTSSDSTQVQELLNNLDQLDGLLSKVEQAPSRSMQDALYPSMKALISDQLLKNSDIDVKVWLASCMSELTRITAPDAPYDDVQMKEIFQLTVMALGILSSEANRGYSKALHTLDNMAKVRSCLLMLDLECDLLITDMFKQFLSTIRHTSLAVVFKQMEYIMTLTIEESEEIPEEVLIILLTSVSKEKDDQNVLSRSWRLGEKVLMNCAVELQRFLPKVVRSRNLNLDDYSNIVASICQNANKNEKEVVEEADPSANQSFGTMMDNGNGPERSNGTLSRKDSFKTLEHCHQGKQQEYTEAGRHLQPEHSDAEGIVQEKEVKIRKKRGRKPKSLQNPEVGCDNSLSGERASSFQTSRSLRRNVSNTSASQQASHTDGSQSTKCRRKNNSTLVNACHEVASPASGVKKECDDSEEYHGKGLGMPHDIKVFGEKLVGRRVKIWWPLDKMFYEGAVASFDSVTQMHKVLYADGDEETLNLRNERWELLEEQRTEFSSPAGTSHKSLQKKKKAKTTSSAKQQGTSLSKCHSSADKNNTEAPKCGSSSDVVVPDAVYVANVRRDDVAEQTLHVSKPDYSKPVVLGTFDVAKNSIAEPNPHNVVEVGAQSAISTTSTEKDVAPREKLNEDVEKGILPDSVDAQGSDSSIVMKRRRLATGKGITP